MSTMISMGLSGRNLKDHDAFSKSDPYFTLSRPSPTGAFSLVRNSETKKNTLNPDWSDIMASEMEMCGGDRDLNLKLEVYDDDGKAGPDGKDKLIGVGFFSLKQLEAANTVQSPMQITDGKKGKARGQILVRTFKVHQGSGSGGQNNNSRYQAGGNPFPGQQQQQQPGYPGQGYPGQNPPGQGYPGQNPPGQNPPGQGYPGQNPPGQGYPGQNPGQGYPGQNPPAMYPGQGAPMYPGQGAPMPGYPGQGAPMPGYPSQNYGPTYPPQPQQGYPPNPAYPPQGNAPYGAPGYPPQQPFGSNVAPMYPSIPGSQPNGAMGAANQMGFQYPPS